MKKISTLGLTTLSLFVILVLRFRNTPSKSYSKKEDNNRDYLDEEILGCEASVV